MTKRELVGMIKEAVEKTLKEFMHNQPVVYTCNLQIGPVLVKAEFEPEEPQTMWHPGAPRNLTPMEFQVHGQTVDFSHLLDMENHALQALGADPISAEELERTLTRDGLDSMQDNPGV